MSAKQIERVAARLACADARQLRVLVIHQSVALARAENEHNLLRGHTVAVQRWAIAGGDLLMGGHMHVPLESAAPWLHQQSRYSLPYAQASLIETSFRTLADGQEITGNVIDPLEGRRVDAAAPP